MKRNADHKVTILCAARELFATKGVEATTTRQISRTAKTAEGLLYYYFPHGKQEILDTIVTDGLEERMKKFTTAISQGQPDEPLEDRLMAVFDAICHTFAGKPSYQSFIITIRERSLLSEPQSHWIVTLLDKITSQINTMLSAISPFCDLDDSPRQQLAELVAAVFQKVMYDELLILNHRTIAPEARKKVGLELHLLLNMAEKTSQTL